jgi:carboxypeptidase C (cathepsin A)
VKSIAVLALLGLVTLTNALPLEEQVAALPGMADFDQGWNVFSGYIPLKETTK